MQPSASIVEVTPAIAAEWLRRNTDNRPRSLSTEARYSSLMSSGRWMLSCDAVGFDRNGRLINGQHRLGGVIRSGTTQRMLVVWGLDPDVFEVLDVGKKRGAGDVLAILGYKHYNILAAAARCLVGYSRDGRTFYSMFGGNPVENDEIVAAVKRHPGLADSTEFVTGFAKHFGKWMSMSSLSFLHYVYAREYPIEASTFIEKLATGEGLSSEAPALVLRDRLIREAMAKTSLPRGEAAALVILCFNRHVEGRRMKIVRWSPENGMEYPQPIVEGIEPIRAGTDGSDIEVEDTAPA